VLITQESPMKRFHVHAHVDDLSASIAFYTKLFGDDPVRVESDYAKWMIEDPRVNFAISTRGGKAGVDHLGLQTDTEEELVELKDRARAADLSVFDEGQVTCCHARSEKHWVTDPQGIAWEHFRTLRQRPAVHREARAWRRIESLLRQRCIVFAAGRDSRQVGLVLLLRKRAGRSS
jgi:lactoylglutathione lyase